MFVYRVEYNLKVKGLEDLRDFVRNDSYSIFKLDQNPMKDFMIDASINELGIEGAIESGL